jgi:hypothetical protein
MDSEKQLLANQQNALLSTGPKTTQGKAIVATNAIKHGIFTKDLLISSSLGKENEEDYLEMLNNLVVCLAPQNQMESLLVEKIAIDFWRLQRVIRFEAGSIENALKIISKEFYSYSRKNNEKIDIEIQEKKEYINWIDFYVKYLQKEEVSFDNPTWEVEEIESDILEDFCLIIKTIDSLTYQEKEKLLYDDCDFSKIKTVLKQNGYSSKKEISAKLLEVYALQKQKLEKELEDLGQTRIANAEADRLNVMLGMIPQENNTDKILKYERSIQKSIFQNLFLLRKLQGIF